MGIMSLRMFGALSLVGLTLIAGVAIDFSPEMAWYDQQRIEQIVLLQIIALAAASVSRKALLTSLANLSTFCRWALGVGFLFGAVSAMCSSYPRFAWLEWATLLLLTGLVFLLAEQAWRGNLRFDVLAVRLVVVLVGVISMKIVTSYLAAVLAVKHLDTLMLFEGTFSNRRFFGQVASMAVPLLAYPLLMNKTLHIQRWGLYALLTVCWMLVIVSGTRGTWVALGVASVTLALVAWHASHRWLRIQLLTAMAGALLFGVMFVWVPLWLGLDASVENRLPNLATLSGRHELWKLAWTQIQAHPWLGIGPMHLAAIRNDFGAHPHNAVLQLAAEWGVPAALALILPCAAGVQHLLTRLRQQKGSPNMLLVCLTASLLAACVQSMVDGVIVIPYTQTLLALVAGWALGVYFRETIATPVTPSSPMMGARIFLLPMFALAALLNGIFPEVLNRVEVTQAYVDAGNQLIPPRYWGVGWIP